MRAWAYMLAGLIIWTVHFFALYIVASIFLTTTIARVLTLVITVGCLAADGWLLWRLNAARKPDGFDEWMRTLSLAGLGISFVAVLFQGLPALLV
jgi:hypothetical protein